jgi:hypothetical protein
MKNISVNQKTKFQEDIKTSGGGTNLISVPCVVWNLTVSREAATGVAVVSLSDSSSTYSSTNKVLEVIVSGPAQPTHSISFPKGLYLKNGLTAISNLTSVDISVVYD